jgi:lipid A 4'-phosphatase
MEVKNFDARGGDPPWALSRTRTAMVWGLGLTAACGLLFVNFPEIDLIVSRFFYWGSEAGAPRGFGLTSSSALHFFFKSVDVISRIVLIAAIGLTIFFLWKKNNRALPATIVTLSLVLGPVLLVNGVFKDHWDRARPRELIEFGGSKKFTPAWIISDQCNRNCSFTSGHAAAGFSFVVGHFVATSRIWLWLGLIVGSFTGLTRIAVGAHFLSDVVFSFFAVYLVAALVTYGAIRITQLRKASSA